MLMLKKTEINSCIIEGEMHPEVMTHKDTT